jgi:RNA polymerase Rpc34 subunit
MSARGAAGTAAASATVVAAVASANGGDSAALENEILEICHSTENGVTDADIRTQLITEATPQARLGAYNALLARGRLQVVERPVGADGRRVVVYKWISAENARRLAGLSPAERMAFELIAKSRSAGQTRKDIKTKTNIQNSAELKGIIERLTARGLIKEIKSVLSANKRVYIVAELEASQSHTGGPWYGDDQEFDAEFINAMYDFSLEFIADREYVSVQDLTDHVAQSGLSNEPLTTNDIRKLVYTMLHDSQVEICRNGSGGGSDMCFRKTRAIPSSRSHTAQPCFNCPVKLHCTPGGVISQKNCVYMTDWISAANDW